MDEKIIARKRAAPTVFHMDTIKPSKKVHLELDHVEKIRICMTVIFDNLPIDAALELGCAMGEAYKPTRVLSIHRLLKFMSLKNAAIVNYIPNLEAARWAWDRELYITASELSTTILDVVPGEIKKTECERYQTALSYFCRERSIHGLIWMNDNDNEIIIPYKTIKHHLVEEFVTGNTNAALVLFNMLIRKTYKPRNHRRKLFNSICKRQMPGSISAFSYALDLYGGTSEELNSVLVHMCCTTVSYQKLKSVIQVITEHIHPYGRTIQWSKLLRTIYVRISDKEISRFVETEFFKDEQSLSEYDMAQLLASACYTQPLETIVKLSDMYRSHPSLETGETNLELVVIASMFNIDPRVYDHIAKTFREATLNDVCSAFVHALLGGFGHVAWNLHRRFSKMEQCGFDTIARRSMQMLKDQDDALHIWKSKCNVGFERSKISLKEFTSCSLLIWSTLLRDECLHISTDILKDAELVQHMKICNSGQKCPYEVF
ncbi:MAG: hypothetical protein PHN45_00270 [Methylococcales bacterium]|nr:hypothetical protein [Methylococcales bacterium]